MQRVPKEAAERLFSCSPKRPVFHCLHPIPAASIPIAKFRCQTGCYNGLTSTGLRQTDWEEIMDQDAKKSALRMIPYGIYVMTAEGKDGSVAAATVNWVTQASFAPPLVAVGVKADSGAHAIVKESGSFVLNILGKGQQSLAFNFFKSHDRGRQLHRRRVLSGWHLPAPRSSTAHRHGLSASSPTP